MAKKKPHKRVQVLDLSNDVLPIDLRYTSPPVRGSVVASPLLTALVQPYGQGTRGGVRQRSSDDGALWVRLARGPGANLRIVMATTALRYPMYPGVWESEYYYPPEGSVCQVAAWWASIPRIGPTASGYHEIGLCSVLQSTWGVLAVYPATEPIDIHRYWAYGSPTSRQPSTEAVWRDVITSIVGTHTVGIEWWYGPVSDGTQTGTRSQTLLLLEWDI